MGNCGFKSKKATTEVRAPREVPRGANLRINRGVNCPKCNMHFPQSTPFLIINSHIVTCLLTDESALNGSNIYAHENAIDQNNIIIPNSNSRNANPKHIWIKKIDANNKATWEKTPTKSNMTVDHLENMSIESAKELSFEDKKKWFKLQMDKIRIPWVCGADQLHVSHKNLVDSALKNIKKVHMHKEVKIVFEEEKNVNDAGGLLREFIQLLCQETFSKEYRMFVKTQTDEIMYTINPGAPDTPRTVELYNLIGKVIGKALFEQMSLPMQFDHLLLKQIIQKDFDLEDLAYLDKQLYKSLKFLRENSIDKDDIFDEYFVVTSPIDGEEIELTPDGKDIRICDENKEEYIDLILEWFGRNSIEMQLEALLEGLFEVVPKENFKVFSVQELEMMLYGLPFIDVNDWESTTVYKGGYYKNHQTIKLFWEVIRDLNQEQLSKFFYFCTGSKRPPVEGFSALQSNRGEIQKFTIESVKFSKDNASLKAHTCFNRLDLPTYSDKTQIQHAVETILQMDFSGVFGLE